MKLKNFGQKAALTTAIVAGAFAGIGIGYAQQTVPMGGVYVSGAGGSEWHDQQLFRNATEIDIKGKLYVVPRSSKNNDQPGYDPASSQYVDVEIPANTTQILDDVFLQVIGVEGAGALWFVPDDGDPDPVWRSRVFTRDGNAESGLTITPHRLNYSGPTTILTEVLSGTGQRDSVFLESGSEGVSGRWEYRSSSGRETVTVPQSLGPYRTFQWTGGVKQLIGFTPEPGGQLDFIIESGRANAYVSRTNNQSNDGAFNRFEAMRTDNNIDAAILYVNHWLPRRDSRFYLSNREIRSMINGDQTRSYARDLAVEFYKDPVMQGEFDSLDEVEDWIRARADGVPDNSEFCPDFDPFLWTTGVGTRIYDGVSCGPVDFKPGEEALQNIYTIVSGIDENGNAVDGFLWSYVSLNPSLYGGVIGGEPDIGFNPTWNTQDPN